MIKIGENVEHVETHKKNMRKTRTTRKNMKNNMRTTYENSEAHKKNIRKMYVVMAKCLISI